METVYKFIHTLRSVKFYPSALIFSIVLFSVGQQASAQGSKTRLTIPDEFLSPDFVGTGNFNAIVFGNFQTNSGDVEGRLAVAGNFNISTSGYSVGTAGIGSNAPDLTDNFVVNGVFSNIGNWGLRGNLVYNTAAPGTVFPSLMVAGTSIKGGKFNHIRFSDNALLLYYRGLSGTLDALPNTGTHTFDGYHQWTLTGTSTGLNVFDILLPNSISSDEIRVNIPDGASAIINILNTSLTINGGSMRMNGADKENAKVLFNFPNATSISLSHYKFLGNFLAPKASLSGYGGSINGQSIIGGHVDQQGGFEFHNFYYDENSIALPVTLVKFSAAKENSAVNLAWSTTSEMNSSHFDIERSANGKTWNRIGTVASHGESTRQLHYTFTDAAPDAGENLYRLKMVDLDNTFAYSSIQSILIGAEGAVAVYPNPASDRILVANSGNVKLLTITDLSGRKVYEAQSVSATGVDCKNLASGMYVVTVTRVNGAVDSGKVLIVK